MQKIFFWILMLGVCNADHNYTNALIKEASPYLKQHAHNPVNWYPWGDVAFEKAKKEHKLIFLSIGYSTCHWCHVMEEESFSDLEVAKILNTYFVSIKVDREQYPHIDKKYQQQYMAHYGRRGGWPLSVFLSSEKKVFFMGTYIPKEEGYGSKGLLALLPSFVQMQQDKRVLDNAVASYSKIHIPEKLNIKKTVHLTDTILEDLFKSFDTENGGFGRSPKFPEASKISLLWDIYQLNGSQKAFNMVVFTLEKIAKSGLYDQIHGGFFRYTIDSGWQIPHFEKMLYTNASLITLYAHIYRMRENPLYKKVVEESIAQMLKNYSGNSLYFSASDADSGDEEGGYFIYAYATLKQALVQKGWNSKEIEAALAYLGIEEDGNIDGDFSQPHIVGNHAPIRLEALKHYLREVSKRRHFPFVDKKINTAWNAMMIKALFEASSIDKLYLCMAQKSLDVLLMLMRRGKILYHQTLLDTTPTQKALLEDYAFLIDALITGYEKIYNEKYLKLAQRLTNEALKKFYKHKRWYLSDDDTGVEADFDDRYYTAALSVMLDNLLCMSVLTDTPAYRDVVRETIDNSGAVLRQNPTLASKLVDVFLRLQKGTIMIHASKKQLLLSQKEIESILYPFVLSKAEESEVYLACKAKMCFAYDKNITKLIEKIKKEVQ